jgi:16S rRNA G1207 methylase RsmC
MALDVDGFAIFRSIGSHPDVFVTIAAELSKTARTLVVKYIRRKDTGLKALQAVRAAVGAEAFSLIADGMADSQIKSLAVKLDKHNSELKTSSAAAQRRHVMALADGSVDPLEKQKSVSAKPKKRQPPSSPANRIQFSSAGVVRKR